MKFRAYVPTLERNENGTGIIGTMFGALVFLAFVAFAAHTMIGLYASSVVSSVVWDEAKQVATNQTSIEKADGNLSQRLSGFTVLELSWDTSSSETIVLTVKTKRPSLLPQSLAKRSVLTTIERTAVVRKEGVS